MEVRSMSKGHSLPRLNPEDLCGLRDKDFRRLTAEDL
jgi:hypothetical protein